MSSNSPVLLLAPSAVPTAPIMAPLLVAKPADLRARGLMPSPFQPEKPSEAPSPAAVGKALPIPSPPLRVEAPSMPSAPPPSPVVETAKQAPSPTKVVSPIVAVVMPPGAQVANAAPIVGARPTVPTPTLTTPTTTPVQAVSLVVAATPPSAVATSPVRPSVAAPSMLTRATPLTPLVTSTIATTTTTPTTTKRAAAVAAAAASAAAVGSTTTAMALTIAASSPSASPKSAPSSPLSPKSSAKSSTGRWTEAEHKLFLKGLEQFPYRAWKKIATLIKTRTVVQIRTHAQKYYQKLEKEEQRMREREMQLAAQQQQQQQGAAVSASAASASVSAAAAAAALSSTSSSAVSTPRSAVLSTPTTPAAAASFRELSLTTPFVTTPSAAAAASSHFAFGREEVDVPTTFTGAAGKRKAPMRKRKSSADETSDVPSSLPKRMMKEKKFVRDKTMSPKQKTVVSYGRAFGFGSDAADGMSSGDDCAKGGTSMRGISGLKTHPLDFDDDDDVTTGTTTTSMILDFDEEKPMEYPFTLDTALERGLAAIDHDELLQLSDDDEGMEWFASATAGEDVDLLDISAAGDSDDAATAAAAMGSPMELDGNAFSPLYSEEALHFVNPSPATSECSTPSPILSSAADCSDFGLSGDEADDDEDFVLDPEKFLSSYFSPRAAADHDEDATAL